MNCCSSRWHAEPYHCVVVGLRAEQATWSRPKGREVQ
jgi:hypothetical protein